MQIGRANSTGGSNSTTQLGLPAHMITDDAAGELYVADGYGNRRVAVLDMKTGAFKRLWGAYGNVPSDSNRGTHTSRRAADSAVLHTRVLRRADAGRIGVCV